MYRHCLALLGFVCALLLGAPHAHAASFQVNPVSLTLKATAASGMLAVRNMGTEEVRVQIGVFAWRQSPSGEIELQPTQDLVFFPSILTIAPRDSRNVRISAARSLALTNLQVEKTYRILVEELLPPNKVNVPFTGLRVLTRMSIPIFAEPQLGRPIPTVEALSARAREASFSVVNKGTAHFMVRAVRVFVTAPDGRRLFETSLAGWYVLARSSRAYRIPLPEGACSNGARLGVEIETDRGNASQSGGSMQCS